MENTEQLHRGDLLSTETDPFFQFTHATTGQRFLNFLIDNIVMRFGLTYITGFAVGYLLAIAFRDVQWLWGSMARLVDTYNGCKIQVILRLHYLFLCLSFIFLKWRG